MKVMRGINMDKYFKPVTRKLELPDITTGSEKREAFLWNVSSFFKS
jgi:hypothetical protein